MIKVIHLISSLQRGGRERQLATINKYTNKFNYPTKIIVFNRSKNNYIAEYKIAYKDLYYLKSKNTIKRLFEITKIYNEFKPDIIYAWGGFEATFGLSISPFINAKFINGSIRHGIVLFRRKHIWRLILLHLSKFVVANSYAGLKANHLKKGYVLYNGTDGSFQKNIPSENRLEMIYKIFPNYKNELILISVANLVPYKDYFTILEALKKLSDKGYRFYYLIIGEGLIKRVITDKIEKFILKDNINLLGRINDVQNYLQIADIFIHSSLGEGCSNAILEAMAAGLPIIASDTGGTSEIVTENNGFLFEYKNAEQLESRIKKLLDDPHLRLEMGHQSAKFARENFTVDVMMRNYYNILKEVFKKR